MTQTPHKICPKCHQPAILTASNCGRCGHIYSTKFAVPAMPTANHSVASSGIHCRACYRTFNFLTKSQYDEQTGYCTSCLAKGLGAFAQFFTSHILMSPYPPQLEQIRQVTEFASSRGLDPSYAYQTVKQQSIQMLYRIFAMFKSDEVITAEEENYIAMFEREVFLAASETASIHAEINYYKAVQQIRSGKLPKIFSAVIMPNSEICHWESVCTYHKVLTSQTKRLHGSIIVSNQKIRFVSGQGGFEFPLSKIASVQYSSQGGINLTLTRSTGNGFYTMQNAQLLCEIMDVLLKQHHRQTVFNHQESRGVPQDVKAQVWQRDGGKCVQCGANDYLEFDHVIPFSKGGSNSVKNIQLLCRRCNLSKSDNI